jgi:uncharacterized protein YcaQ
MKTFPEHVVNHYILHKHHLLESSKAKGVLQVVNDIIALHATSVGTTYLSLFARMKNFQREHLDEEFYIKRNLVRLRAMRGTLFITSLELAPMLYQATKLPESQLLNLTHRWGISLSEYSELSEKLHNFLKSGGKTLTEIRKALPKELVRTVEFRDGKSVYRWTNVKVVLTMMMRRGLVISEKDAGTLRLTKANRYVLFQEIYAKLNLSSATNEEAKTILVKRYIKTFGPVTEEDIAWWTGFNKTDMKEALASIQKELLYVKLNGLQGDYLTLETDYKQFVKFKPLETRFLSLLTYEDPLYQRLQNKR